jgi:hypothetical protein
VIVDAGGGTIDVNSYSRNQKGSFEEIAAPQCSFVFSTLKTVSLPLTVYQVTSTALFL